MSGLESRPEVRALIATWEEKNKAKRRGRCLETDYLEEEATQVLSELLKMAESKQETLMLTNLILFLIKKGVIANGGVTDMTVGMAILNKDSSFQLIGAFQN